MQDIDSPVWFLDPEDSLEKDRIPTPIFLGFPCDSAGKQSTCNMGDLGSILGLGRSPGEGKVYPPQYSGMYNSPWSHKESDTTERLSLSGSHSGFTNCQFSWIQLGPTLWDPKDCSMPSFPINHQLPVLKLMSIKSVMPYNHLILCHPLPLQPSIFPSISVFSNELVLPIRWPKYWSFSFSNSPSNEYSGLISLGLTG